ncbi:hypothetical protein K458DRAFT_391420 [Lentithecium fluviatile CBS 122367]|uniref:Uncharacterized protein n=1 Tax=Lentithecium fluviatile CBS 122367 TaxID=1168545 RepID=A0A6G1IVJ9_9PLEO|nr:hypothetical protein K458DRAFT_391420 [Lentithecium fluviatile CBS 122367]
MSMNLYILKLTGSQEVRLAPFAACTKQPDGDYKCGIGWGAAAGLPPTPLVDHLLSMQKNILYPLFTLGGILFFGSALCIMANIFSRNHHLVVTRGGYCRLLRVGLWLSVAMGLAGVVSTIAVVKTLKAASATYGSEGVSVVEGTSAVALMCVALLLHGNFTVFHSFGL